MFSRVVNEHKINWLEKIRNETSAKTIFIIHPNS